MFFCDAQHHKRCDVTCKQLLVGSCSFIHPNSPCLLIGICRPFTLKVIINMCELISAVFLLAIHCPCSLFLSFVFQSFFCLPWFYLNILQDSILFPLLTCRLYFFSNSFSHCSRVCKIHLKVIRVHFQITLYHFMVLRWYSHFLFLVPYDITVIHFIHP